MSMALMPTKGAMMPPSPYTSRLRRSRAAAPMARNLTPRSASGTSTTMINALNITADRMALSGVFQMHHVEHLQLRIGGDENGRQDGEIFGDIVGDRERRQRAASDQQLLADLDDFDELGGVAVEIDHVAGLARRLRAGLHGDADIGLRQSRRVVGAVAAHRHQPAIGLDLADII